MPPVGSPPDEADGGGGGWCEAGSWNKTKAKTARGAAPAVPPASLRAALAEIKAMPGESAAVLGLTMAAHLEWQETGGARPDDPSKGDRADPVGLCQKKAAWVSELGRGGSVGR